MISKTNSFTVNHVYLHFKDKLKLTFIIEIVKLLYFNYTTKYRFPKYNILEIVYSKES